MKKTFTLLALAALGISTPAFAAYYVAGDFNSWAADGSQMTESSTGSGIWQATVTPGAGRHEFKITDGTWTTSYPGPNSWLVADSGDITITYDVNTYADGWQSASQRIGLSVDPGTWTAAGDFEGWDNAAGDMTSLGGGIYEYTVSTPGSHSWKAVVTGSWDSISSDARSINTANWDFTINAGEEANLYVDALKGVVKVDIVAVPEPSTLALLGCGLAGLLCMRRRS